MGRIWIDTDLALGARRGDVDDGFALAAVAASGAELAGVSTVFGNTGAATAADCARRLLRVCGREVEVIEGARGPGEGGAAARAIAALPGGTSLLALGPLTNVAAALALDPGLARRIDVRAVGGNLASWGRWAPYWPFEFNFAKDPDAAWKVLSAPGLSRRIFPLDVCRRLTIGLRGLREIGRTGAIGMYLQENSWRWLAYAPVRYQRLSFPLWDLVPALEALGLIEVEVTERRLALEGGGRLVAGGEPSRWARAIDPPATWRAFVRLLRSAA
jgi:inosine-uridine nucleoside N-ribohydrolase